MSGLPNCWPVGLIQAAKGLIRGSPLTPLLMLQGRDLSRQLASWSPHNLQRMFHGGFLQNLFFVNLEGVGQGWRRRRGRLSQLLHLENCQTSPLEILCILASQAQEKVAYDWGTSSLAIMQ